MSFEQRAFRDALGQFPTGVTVITVNPEGGEPFGVTANSFASVSLDPPLILWSLQKNSDTFADFEKARRFAVNVLKSDQQELSNQYAKKHNHQLGLSHYRLGEAGTPLINGAIVGFECEIDVRHDGGDHIILVGKVLAMSDITAGDPLVFCAGKYCEIQAEQG